MPDLRFRPGPRSLNHTPREDTGPPPSASGRGPGGSISMTVNAVRRPRRRGAAPPSDPIAPPPIESMAIGEIDQTVFDCPNCSRPLAMGARRCPGCRTRLVIGVPLSKASVLAAAGLAAGLIVGSVGGVVFAATHVPSAPAGSAGAPSAAPVGGGSGGTSSPSAVPSTASPAVTTAPTPQPDPDAMPPLARSALAQAITVDERLASSSDTLRAALAATPFDASDVAEILRTVSADSVYGQQLADRVSGWPGSADLGGSLATLYGSVHDAATTALMASVRNEAAYRESARTMVALLGGVAAVDAQARALANEHGVTLPTSSSAP